MKKISLLIGLLAVIACSHKDKAEDNIKSILELSQYETLTRTDYDEIIRLYEEYPEEIEKSLEEKDGLFLFKMELLDMIHEDAFNEFNDTLALHRRLEICSWAKENYPEDSKEGMLADSKLVEIYTELGDFSSAKEQLNRNLSHTKFPTIDHANCVYTEGWLHVHMNKPEDAKVSLGAALVEYQILEDMVNETLASSDLPDKEIELFSNAKEEILTGIEETTNLLDTISGQPEE